MTVQRSHDLPTFVMGALSDHLTPWKGTYRTTQLLSGESRFVLSNAGHIASLVNPPGNPKASYFTGSLDRNESPDEWRARADQHTGSWWQEWAEWVLERTGDEVAASQVVPREELHLSRAPGTYVFERA